MITTVAAYIGFGLLLLIFVYLLGRLFGAGWFQSRYEYINSLYKRTTTKGEKSKHV